MYCILIQLLIVHYANYVKTHVIVPMGLYSVNAWLHATAGKPATDGKSATAGTGCNNRDSSNGRDTIKTAGMLAKAAAPAELAASKH
jgi:hypothetical protein